MFRRLGRVVAERPLAVIIAWALAGAALVTARLGLADRTIAEPASFLPADSEEQRGIALMEAAFPALAARSQAAVILCRPGGLQPPDFDYARAYADTVRRHAAEHNRRWTVLSPSEGYLRQRLVSADGEAAILVVNLPTFYAGAAAADAVDAIESLGVAGRPPGLQVELSGTAGVGRDLGRTMKLGVRRTLWVTVACVLLILLLVYRSPVAAALPLVGVSVCTILALRTLDILGTAGWQVSDLERMFTVVLLYGAGTDFAMFWLARYREERAACPGPEALRRAAAEATWGVGPAIVASSATTILGLLSLIATDMVPTHNAGQVLGLVLCWAPLAGVTLVPSMVVLAGRVIFWPVGERLSTTLGQRHVWPRLAAVVVRHPGAVLLIGVALLSPAALRAGSIRFRYDTLAELPAGSSSERGAAIARRHFAEGSLYPITLLIRSPEATLDAGAMRTLSRQIAQALLPIDGVAEVSDWSRPLGSRAEPAEGLGRALLTAASEPFYLSTPARTMRIEIALRDKPLSNGAMQTFQQVREVVRQAVRTAGAPFGPNSEILAIGATPYILQVRDYMARDQWRVWIGATVVIWLVLVLLVRRAGLSLFMIAATLLTYAATLGVSHEFFTRVLGQDGLDYKVRLFLFVIIVAVGQDYNIFLVTRLRQETEAHGPDEGTRRAVIRTGSVISNCGLIMAATLGSLWAGGLDLLRQLGFALALGMVLDTFIVRPLLMPSFWLYAQRRSRAHRAT